MKVNKLLKKWNLNMGNVFIKSTYDVGNVLDAGSRAYIMTESLYKEHKVEAFDFESEDCLNIYIKDIVQELTNEII